MNFKKMRMELGLAIPAFADRYNIPHRTVENWEGGKSSPPPYVADFLEKEIKRDLELLKLANACAQDLGIKCPPISFDIRKKSKGHVAGLCVVENKVKMLEVGNYSDDITMRLAICHEMRHAYQVEMGMFNPTRYREISTVSINEYAIQPQEVDAKAYAAFFVAKNFGVKPLFINYSENIRAAISKRIDEIVSERQAFQK